MQILIADGDSVFRNDLRHSFLPYRFDVILAKNGQTAWTQFKRCQPEIVILDTNLSVLSSTALIKKIKQQQQRKTEIIVISNSPYKCGRFNNFWAKDEPIVNLLTMVLALSKGSPRG